MISETVAPDAVQMDRETWEVLKRASEKDGSSSDVDGPGGMLHLGLPVNLPKHHPPGISWWLRGRFLGLSGRVD